jgi:hypothetical protein
MVYSRIPQEPQIEQTQIVILLTLIWVGLPYDRDILFFLLGLGPVVA